jgi:hypothetical protein
VILGLLLFVISSIILLLWNITYYKHVCVYIQQKCANKYIICLKKELFKLQVSLLLVLYVDAHSNQQNIYFQNLMGYDF